MEYIRLMTKLRDHPKWLATKPLGRSALIGIWLYCGHMETNGNVPVAAARREGLTVKLAAELEELGWLHRNGEGWHVHDWEEHQVPAERLAEKRRLARARSKRWREKHPGDALGDA
jgi:hypothetical protein